MVLLAAVLAGCAGKPSTGAIEVQVNLEPGLESVCVKVTASDGVDGRETRAIPLAGKTSPLHIGMVGDGLVSPITITALGYSDPGCTVLTPGEVSDPAQASYQTPKAVVVLTLRPASNGDGGTDGGADAGIDNDLDGSPLPADCDDTNPNIHPGANESLACANGLDDDCDNLTDCADPVCDSFACPGAGTCTAGACTGSQQEFCSDGVDNNGNGLADCADPACGAGTTCTDGNACTTGDRCLGGGVCQKLADVTCNTPPAAQCYAGMGVCLADAGATCFYAPTAGGCNDQNNCTTGDTCDGDGGCRGTAVTCNPNQCQTASTGCTDAGSCLFGTRNGLTCDAGTGAPATCNPSFNCIPVQTGLFPYVPSNFTEGQLPTDGGVAFTVDTPRTLDTSGTPSITVGTMPPFTLITQGGQSTVLVKVTSFSVLSGQTLLITGTRPIIFAVLGDALVDGTIRASNGPGPAACGNGGNGDGSGMGNGFSGGGGGGFGSAGGVGGTTGGSGAGALGAVNGEPTLMPLRGGCNGGNGSASGGAGGGAIQITASGTLTIAGTLAAPGLGGTGASWGGGDSGGGGGSGGGILLEGATVLINSSARLTANGGSGGEGSGGGSGADGLDGNETSSTATANGGNDEGNGGNGGVGAAGTTAAGPGLSGGDQNDGAGGGGGGVGRIRVNASTSCTIAGSGKVISPAYTSNGATGC